MNQELLNNCQGINVIMLIKQFSYRPWIIYHTLYDIKDLVLLQEFSGYKLVSFLLDKQYIILHDDKIIHQDDSIALCKKYINRNEKCNSIQYHIIDVLQFNLWYMTNKHTKDIKSYKMWVTKTAKDHRQPTNNADKYKANTKVRGNDGDMWYVKKSVKKDGTIHKRWIKRIAKK